jgi:hypothetical protein
MVKIDVENKFPFSPDHKFRERIIRHSDLTGNPVQIYSNVTK